jgi:anti-sigma factor RsiW
VAQDKRHLTTEQLSAFLDREVSAEEQAQWEAHLSTCPQCQQALAVLRQTVVLLHALPQPTLPRSFILPVEAAEAVAMPRATAPTPIRPAKRKLNPHVREVLRTMSALAAMIGVVFFLSGLLPALVHGGEANSATSGTASSSTMAPSASSTSTAPQNTPEHSTEKGLTPAIKTPHPATQTVQPQPINTSDQPHSVTGQPTSSSWPTIFIFNLSTSAGRLGLGMLLVLLGVMGFVLFKRSQRETRL